MRITHPDLAPYTVDDYDFTFASGIVIPFSVVKDLGDTVDFDSSPLAVKFHFAAKPSQMDTEASTQPEDTTILMNHVIMISHRTRTITPPTHEQRDLFKQTLHALGKSVQ